MRNNSVLLEVEIQKKDRIGGIEKCTGKNRPTLGPLAIIVPVTLSCTRQPL